MPLVHTLHHTHLPIFCARAYVCQTSRQVFTVFDTMCCVSSCREWSVCPSWLVCPRLAFLHVAARLRNARRWRRTPLSSAALRGSSSRRNKGLLFLRSNYTLIHRRLAQLTLTDERGEAKSAERLMSLREDCCVRICPFVPVKQAN